MTEGHSGSGQSGSGRLIEDAVRLIINSFTEVVPTEAQLHLLNAQREMLLALAIIIDHNASRSISNPRATRKTKATTAKSKRPTRVSIH